MSSHEQYNAHALRYPPGAAAKAIAGRGPSRGGRAPRAAVLSVPAACTGVHEQHRHSAAAVSEAACACFPHLCARSRSRTRSQCLEALVSATYREHASSWCKQPCVHACVNIRRFRVCTQTVLDSRDVALISFCDPHTMCRHASRARLDVYPFSSDRHACLGDSQLWRYQAV